jgi:ribosomal protein S1
MKQLEATSADQFAKEVSVGDRVSGRVIQVRGNKVTVQLGEGVEGICVVADTPKSEPSEMSSGSLAAQLAAAWKGGLKTTSGSVADSYREGEVRSFTIKSIDSSGKRIELLPA